MANSGSSLVINISYAILILKEFQFNKIMKRMQILKLSEINGISKRRGYQIDNTKYLKKNSREIFLLNVQRVKEKNSVTYCIGHGTILLTCEVRKIMLKLQLMRKSCEISSNKGWDVYTRYITISKTFQTAILYASKNTTIKNALSHLPEDLTRCKTTLDEVVAGS